MADFFLDAFFLVAFLQSLAFEPGLHFTVFSFLEVFFGEDFLAGFLSLFSDFFSSLLDEALELLFLASDFFSSDFLTVFFLG